MDLLKTFYVVEENYVYFRVFLSLTQSLKSLSRCLMSLSSFRDFSVFRVGKKVLVCLASLHARHRSFQMECIAVEIVLLKIGFAIATSA